ncbi:hypothetical protein ACO2Q3_16145 [Caulobacter sp. KR2-114]|uniref:hypothetical protein n=1 Tax=Caulobacter sp. KR2-114 TaxID=3400912 RepID=UPI003BFF398C
MSAILFPVAADAESALAASLGRAGREREAERLAGAAVRFVSEAVGPLYGTRDAALDACAGQVEDDRPGRLRALPPEDRYCQLREVVAGAEGRWPTLSPLTPDFADGRRWPKPADQPRLPTGWRLSVSYWRIQAAADAGPSADQARQARKTAAGAEADPDALRAMAAQPLRPVRPQQPLDIGLFEVRPPEAPDTLIPDE